ncbi:MULTISPECIES: hypothetical protein [unclassified Microcoleus]|uniref:hypothetical protein n=1 Tax=unclassified Microcoleus TaxID=2642155 RepID=UPI0025F6B587|nr:MULTISPECIES: hypothetical protein [unclassified Microcoleus]
MNAAFCQAVVAAFNVAFQAIKKIDEQSGGSGETQESLTQAITSLNDIASRMSSEVLDITPEVPTEPAQ